MHSIWRWWRHSMHVSMWIEINGCYPASDSFHPLCINFFSNWKLRLHFDCTSHIKYCGTKSSNLLYCNMATHHFHAQVLLYVCDSCSLRDIAPNYFTLYVYCSYFLIYYFLDHIQSSPSVLSVLVTEWISKMGVDTVKWFEAVEPYCNWGVSTETCLALMESQNRWESLVMHKL